MKILNVLMTVMVLFSFDNTQSQPAAKPASKPTAKPASKRPARPKFKPAPKPKRIIRKPGPLTKQIQELEKKIEPLYIERAIEACKPECLPMCTAEMPDEWSAQEKKDYCEGYCATTKEECLQLCQSVGGDEKSCAEGCKRTCPVLAHTDPDWGWKAVLKETRNLRDMPGHIYGKDENYLEFLQKVLEALEAKTPAAKKRLDAFTKDMREELEEKQKKRAAAAAKTKGKGKQSLKGKRPAKSAQEEADENEIEQALTEAQKTLTPAHRKAAQDAENKEKEVEELGGK